MAVLHRLTSRSSVTKTMYTHVVEYEIKLKLWVEIEEIFAKMAYVFPALPLLILAKLEE